MQQESIYFIPLKKRSLFFRHYAFVDTNDYLADQLFIQEQVQVSFGYELIYPDSEYRIIFCKVRKRDHVAFLAALKRLPAKMLLCGHTDYLDFCRSFQKLLNSSQEKQYE